MMMIVFYLLLVVVAFLYAAVGHGGASGYLALMAIVGVAPALMKPTALMLNLFVSMIAFIQFYRSGYFSWKFFLPFALASVPFSFLGGTISVDAFLYKKILGVLLLFPVARFFVVPYSVSIELKPASLYGSLIIGATIGFLSGLIGIGGGIILSPLILLLRWADQKQTAAVSALFIFVNSLAGLSGQWTQGMKLEGDMLLWVAIAVIGGTAGSWLGAKQFKQQRLQIVLAGVLLIASLKLLLT